MSPNKKIGKYLAMLVSEEYSGIYIKKQLLYLLFLVEVFNALEKLT